MNSGTESAVLTSMRADMKNIMHTLQSKNVEYNNFNVILPGVISGEANENGFINLADGSEISLTKGNKIEHLSSEGNTGNCNSSNQGFYLIISNPKLPNKYIAFNSCFDYKIQVTELNEQDLTSSASTDSTTTPTETTVTTPTETVSSPTTAPDIVTIISKKNYKNNKNK